MKSVARDLRRQNSDVRIYATDTVIAATVGASLDSSVKGKSRIVTIDLGNSHTFASMLVDNEITGYFETHTHSLSPNKLQRFIELMIAGSLTNELVLQEGGHGALVTERCSKPVDSIVVTGPKRNIMQETSLEYSYANPLGDNMMTGPAGLLSLVGTKEGIQVLPDSY
jgi:uncharacterized protein (DUF1786 family)